MTFKITAFKQSGKWYSEKYLEVDVSKYQNFYQLKGDMIDDTIHIPFPDMYRVIEGISENTDMKIAQFTVPFLMHPSIR